VCTNIVANPHNSLHIPKTIHQVYLQFVPGKGMSGEQIFWSDSIRRIYKGWNYILWGDTDIQELIQMNYSRYWGVYRDLHPKIKKADFARAVVLHAFGGLYMDIDFEAWRDATPLLQDDDLILFRDPYFSVTNCIMASVPAHAFWPFYFSHVNNTESENVISHTGPTALSQALSVYLTGTDANIHKSINLHLLKIDVYAPLSPHEGFLPACRYRWISCAERFPNAVFGTYWTGSWYGDPVERICKCGSSKFSAACQACRQAWDRNRTKASWWFELEAPSGEI